MGANYKKSGFTIVELLIVIVVIGILAAITLVAYNGIRQRATETSIKSDLASAHKKIMLYSASKDRFPDNTDAALNEVEFKLNLSMYNQTLYCVGGSGASYALLVSTAAGKVYVVGSNRAISEYTTYPMSAYTSICPALVGASNARYGWDSGTSSWRSLVK